MNFFEEATLRLKQQLKVTEDKQVAEALGMTGSAWTKRKTRGSFPEKELRALAQKHPELGIDVEYVLTGLPAATRRSDPAAGINEAIKLGQLALGSDARVTGIQAALSEMAAREQALIVSMPLGHGKGDLLASDELQLLTAFRTADASGRKAMLLVAKGIANLMTTPVSRDAETSKAIDHEAEGGM